MALGTKKTTSRSRLGSVEDDLISFERRCEAPSGDPQTRQGLLLSPWTSSPGVAFQADAATEGQAPEDAVLALKIDSVQIFQSGGGKLALFMCLV